MQLIIGNKNYSSWSMRAWVLLTHYGLQFEEIRISLFTRDYKQELLKYSAAAKVPVLIDDQLTIWDSLAICEYISQKYLANRALPEAIDERAICRSYCAEMHSGFMAIRNKLPMNCRARRALALDTDVQAEVQRIDALWSEARVRFAGRGDYLFGDFSIADCMYAPMAMRFLTYGVKISTIGQQYQEILLKNPAIRQWWTEAEAEVERLAEFEIGVEINH